MKKRLEDLWFGALLVGFIVFPFAMWGLVLTGNLHLSDPIDDPYLSSDAPPGERAALRIFGFGLWTLASLTVMFLLARDQLKRK